MSPLRARRPALAAAMSASLLAGLTACGTLGGLGEPSAPPAEEPDAASPSVSAEATPFGTESNGTSPSGPLNSASPSDPLDSPTPGGPLDSASPGEPLDTASPGPPNGSPTPGGTASSTGQPAPASCATGGSAPVTPQRAGKVTPQGRRTTEVVTVVSDGRTITAGAREQTDFTAPALTAPDGTGTTDPAAVRRAADLVAAAARTQVLLTRPEAPDANLDLQQRPFNTPGTYALYNASAVLVAEVVVSCGEAEQVWRFTGEGHPTAGQLNCAVEPGQSNALARSVYQSAC